MFSETITWPENVKIPEMSLTPDEDVSVLGTPTPSSTLNMPARPGFEPL